MVPLYSILPLPFLTLLLLLLLSTSPAGATMTNRLILKLCNDSSTTDPNINYTFCTTSLQSAPDSPCATQRHLVMISIRLVKFNATNTKCYINELLSNKKLHPYVKQCLEDCYELYSDALSTVRKAALNYKAGNFVDANIEMSSIMEAPLTCEQGFADKNGIKSPLKKQNANLFELSSIALYMIYIAQ